MRKIFAFTFFATTTCKIVIHEPCLGRPRFIMPALGPYKNQWCPRAYVPLRCAPFHSVPWASLIFFRPSGGHDFPGTPSARLMNVTVFFFTLYKSAVDLCACKIRAAFPSTRWECSTIPWKKHMIQYLVEKESKKVQAATVTAGKQTHKHQPCWQQGFIILKALPA